MKGNEERQRHQTAPQPIVDYTPFRTHRLTEKVQAMTRHLSAGFPAAENGA